MHVTVEQVELQLKRIEPNYAEAAKLGSGAMPHLEGFVESRDNVLAPNAVYLATLIGGERAARLLQKAAKSPLPEVRVQAAFGARSFPVKLAETVLLEVLDDTDPGVVSVALKSTRALMAKGDLPDRLQKKIAAIAPSHPNQVIREAAHNLLSRLHTN